MTRERPVRRASGRSEWPGAARPEAEGRKARGPHHALNQNPPVVKRVDEFPLLIDPAFPQLP
jgi:hypothetical protein